MATAKKKAAPKKAKAKETSARTREKAEAYRKTGAVYFQKGKVGSKAKYNDASLLMSANDLAGRLGRTSKEFKFSDEYGSYSGTEIGRGRTGQRAIDQKKRAEKKAALKRASAAKVAKGKK
jgi:hypothetical protein